MTTAPFSQEDADRISDECGADRAWLIVDGSGELTFAPPPDASYEACHCVLKHIRDHLGNLGINVGYVGNEKARSDD